MKEESSTLHETKAVEVKIRNSRAVLDSNNPRLLNITLKELNKSVDTCRNICNSRIHTNGMPFNLQYATEANDFMRREMTSEVYEDMNVMIGCLNKKIPEKPAYKP